MVKVTGLTEREISLRKKESRLLEITGEVLGMIDKPRICADNPPRGVFILRHHSLEAPGASIAVYVESNTISVESKHYFDEAMRLAEAYEGAFPGEEFTVKKLYQSWKNVQLQNLCL